MTTNSRIKAESFRTRVDFEIGVDRATFIETELRRLAAERDAAVQEAQKTHAEDIAMLAAELKGKAALCEKYAGEHRDELLPAKAKSAETPHSRYGFRLGNRTVALLNRKCSWDTAVLMLKGLKFLDCIRTVEEVNKETILAKTDEQGVLTVRAHLPFQTADVKQPLATIGLKINQAETFYIEPKVDGAETVKATS